MIRVDLLQGSEEWFAEKLGKPSASNVNKILTNSGKESKQRDSYLYQLVAERLSGAREDSYTNATMQMGVEREAESRAYYELLYDVKVEQTGVVYPDERKRYLVSPDALMPTLRGGLELKNVLGKTQVKYLKENVLPSEYFGQVQMALFVTQYEWWDFMTYSPSLRPLIIRVTPDMDYHAELGDALDEFCNDLDALTEQLR